jgi:adenine deaminase
MEGVMKEEKRFVGLLRERGYKFEDPIYSLLFFSSTHLPYIRVTQRGIYDVKKKTVLFPAIMR